MTAIEIRTWNDDHGTIQVHKPGCADLKRKKGVTTDEVENLRDLVFMVYSPDDFTYDPAEWQNYLSQFDLMDCCPEIPMPDNEIGDTPAEIDAEAPVAPTGTRATHHTHKACGHELTPLARAACRATHTWDGTAWVEGVAGD